MTAADFKRIRARYGETQLAFGMRLGFCGSASAITRKVRRFESGDTPIVGTQAVLLDLFDKLGNITR